MKIMIIIFALFLTTVLADSNEKYIDLLPEEEKQEFLDKVARRIMETIETKGNENKFSKELTDDQLKVHNDFVQSILEQEAAQMRRRKGDDSESAKETNSGENLDVRPLRSDKNDDDNNDQVVVPDDDQVDLTVNNVKRRNNDEVLSETSTDNIKVDVVIEDAPVQKRSVRSEIKSDEADKEQPNKAEEELLGAEDLIPKDLALNINLQPTTQEPANTESSTYETEVKESITTSKLSDNDKSEESQHWEMTTKIFKSNLSEFNSNSTEEDIKDDKENTPTRTTTESGARTQTSVDNVDLDLLNPKSIQTYDAKVEVNATASATANTSQEINTTISLYYQDLDSNNTKNSSVNRVESITTVSPNLEGIINTSISTLENSEETTLSSTLSAEGTTEQARHLSSYSTTFPIITTVTDAEELKQETEEVTENTSGADDATTENYETTTDSSELEVNSETSTETTAMPTLTTAKVHKYKNHKRNKSNTFITNHGDTKKRKGHTTKRKPKPKKEDRTREGEKYGKDNKSIKDKNYKDVENGKDDKIDNIKAFKDIKQLHFMEVNKKSYKVSVKNVDNCHYLPCGTYKVYEIPENVPPFLRSPDSLINQPYFVPTYNYDPNNAYYNPRNRLGPNAVEEKSIELETNLLRQGKNADKPEFIVDFIEAMRKFGLYNKNPKAYIPSKHPENKQKKKSTQLLNEKKTTKIARLPNSDEDLHPYNKMKKGLKSHMQAIREALYENKYFGSPEDRDHKDYMEFLYGNTPKTITYEPVVIPGNITQNHTLRTREDKEQKQNKQIKRINTKVRNKNNRGLAQPNNETQNKNNSNVNELHGRVIELYNKLFGPFGPGNSSITSLKKIVNNYIKNKNTSIEVKSKHKYLRNKQKNKRNEKDVKNEADVDNRPIRQQKINIISNVIKFTDEKDVFNNLEKMESINLSSMRSNHDSKVKIYMNILKNLIEEESQALKQYDWLSTTVQIHSGLSKLMELIKRTITSRAIHPSDVQILKYTLFLHKFALEIRQANSVGNDLRIRQLLPRNKNKSKTKGSSKAQGLVHRAWLYLRTILPDLNSRESLDNLLEFLWDVEDGLYDLHEALKNIGRVTKFKNQNWYGNLKDLYLTTDEKHLRELLLHLSVSRLVDMIEYSCKNGLEYDFVEYMKKHKEEAKRTLEEMLFVLKIVDEINNNLE